MVTSTVYNQYMNQHGGSIVSIVVDMWNGYTPLIDLLYIFFC
jgi:galactokinase/mevalonate kinase-like predicted kinase